MNKYKSLSRRSQRMRIKKTMCTDKVAFETKESAYQKGQQCYQCKYCGKWHRSGKIAKLIAQVNKKLKDKKL